MTALEYLRQHGPQSATHLLWSLGGILREELYAELVAAEAAGLARVVVHHAGDDRWCEWEAT